MEQFKGHPGHRLEDGEVEIGWRAETEDGLRAIKRQSRKKLKFLVTGRELQRLVKSVGPRDSDTSGLGALTLVTVRGLGIGCYTYKVKICYMRPTEEMLQWRTSVGLHTCLLLRFAAAKCQGV